MSFYENKNTTKESTYIRMLKEEELSELEHQRDTINHRVSEIALSYFKWTGVGVLLAIPIPFFFRLKGASRFYPLLFLGSAGSIADLSEGYSATLEMRLESKRLDEILEAPNSISLRHDAVHRGWLPEDVLYRVPATHPEAIQATVSTDLLIERES